MKYLILIVLILPMNAMADFCSPSSVVDVPISWEAPTHREKDNNGIEKVLAPEEIKGYIVSWNDVDKTEDSCTLQINLPAAINHTLKLQSGTNHRIRMQTVDVGTGEVASRISTYSNEIFATTLGTKPPDVSDSPPGKISGMIVESK